jgi:hypothetical protein
MPASCEKNVLAKSAFAKVLLKAYFFFFAYRFFGMFFGSLAMV